MLSVFRNGAGLPSLDPQSLKSWIRPTLGDGSTVLIVVQVSMTFLRLFSNLIITRLLTPEAYGVVGIITAVSYVLTMVTDMGLRAFIVRHENASDELIQTVWTIRLIRNIILASIMFLGADFFASLYNAPEVATAIRVSSALFIFDAVSSLAHFTGERERRVIRLSLLDFAQFIFVTTTTIVAAYFLRNYWAIIIASFAGSTLKILASYFLIPHTPVRIHWNKDLALELWNFSRIIIPASMISIILTQTDKFFLANFFPLEELGKFMLASTIAFAISSLAMQYFTRVFYPRFAQEHRADAEAAKLKYYEPRRPLTLLIAFGLGGVIGGADLIVRILFNDLYLGAGIYLSIICLGPLAQLSVFPAELAMVTRGRISTALTAKIIRLCWIAPAGFAAFHFFGPIAVIVAIFLTEAITIPYFWRLLSKDGILNLREEAAIFGLAALGCAIGWAGTMFIEALIAKGILPSF
ncbi:MAG: oligosaccharide flippase family protein [Marinicaulis sp.]|nr:oligosaccharide flippase family protein [Marinicaulis sp.]